MSICILQQQQDKKRPALNRSSKPAMPLRHIGHIVIWEGNYMLDIYNIGGDRQNFNKKSVRTCSKN